MIYCTPDNKQLNCSDGSINTWFVHGNKLLFFQPKMKKNGEPSKIGLGETIYATPLYKCDVCGKVSVPKNVNYRADCYRWNCDNNEWTIESKDMLCTGCWNKIRALVKKETEIYEVKKLSKTLEKEARKWRRSQKQAN